MGKSTKLGCLFVHRKQGLFLSVFVDDIKMAGPSRNWLQCDHVYLGCTQRECKPNETIIEQHTKMFVSRIFCWSNLKNYRDGRNLTHKRQRGRSSKNAWNDTANKKVEQLYKVSHPCLDDHQFKKGGIRISWRIVISLIINCLEVFILGTNWTIWHLVVREQACKISHKMDSGMWQTISKADFLYSSHEWLSSILSCGKRGTAL